MPGSHLTLLARWQMIYYSCETFSGPRGIRTLGLLNAIEARSQLRYGPITSSLLGIKLFGCALQWT